MSTHFDRNSAGNVPASPAWRVVFMGTPPFAIPALDALHAHPEVAVVAAYTPPDRRRGRGRVVEPTPVKQRALALGIPVAQPATLRDPEALARLQSWEPDVIVVAAYGRLLPPAALATPRFGCLNLHPSLLPRHRGPAPVAGAILAGDAETGVSVMLLDEGMDTGPIIAQRSRPITPDQDAAVLTDILFADGASLLMETLPRWARGELAAVPQDDRLATYTGKLERADGVADWTLDAAALAIRQRAYTPWPGLHTRWEGKELKLLDVAPLDVAPLDGDGIAAPPGLVTATDGAPIAIGAGSGLLAVRRLQLEGKRPADAAEFLRGYPQFQGARLG